MQNKKIINGLSGKVFLIEKKDKIIIAKKRKNYKFNKKMSDNNLSPKILKSSLRYIYSEFFHGDHLKLKSISEKQKKMLMNSIVQIHSQVTKCKKNDLIKKYYSWKQIEINNEEKIINSFKEILDNNLQVCSHNDLVEGNLIFAKESVKIIDFDYSCKNVKEFDLISLMNENNINDKKTRQSFYRHYPDIKLEILDQVEKFFCILWMQWASNMHKKTSNQIYKDIFLDKKLRLKTLTNSN